MSSRAATVLHWAPRALALALAGGLTWLTAGAFAGGESFFGALTSLVIQGVPAAFIVFFLATAWQWPLVGAVVFPVVGVAIISATGGTVANPVQATMVVALFATGLLYLGDWLGTRQLQRH